MRDLIDEFLDNNTKTIAKIQKDLKYIMNQKVVTSELDGETTFSNPTIK